MKAILLFLGMATFTAATAQEKPYTKIIERFNKSRNQKVPLRKHDDLRTGPGAAAIPQPKLLYVLENGNKVYALRQDRMPCVVPDMQGYRMPNKSGVVRPYRYNGPGAMPNPGKSLPLF